MRDAFREARWAAALALILLGAELVVLPAGSWPARWFGLGGSPCLGGAAGLHLLQSAAAAEGQDEQPRDATKPGPGSLGRGDPRRSAREHGPGRQVVDARMLPDGAEVFSRGNTRRMVIALTLDDGPRPATLDHVLAILARHNVKATFFFTGLQSAKYPELVCKTARQGHEIGNHTYDHLRLPKLSDAEKGAEIDRCEDLLWSITGRRPRFLRPPGGELDRATRRIARAHGLVVAMYDVNLHDDTPGLQPHQELQSALRRIRPGSIVLGHGAVQATLEILPTLISTLQARGYAFVTLSELAEESTQDH